MVVVASGGTSVSYLTFTMYHMRVAAGEWTMRDRPIFGLHEVCPRCKGSGLQPKRKDNVCRLCWGKGFVPLITGNAVTKVPLAQHRS